jgi:hypothetical protein
MTTVMMCNIEHLVFLEVLVARCVASDLRLRLSGAWEYDAAVNYLVFCAEPIECFNEELVAVLRSPPD